MTATTPKHILVSASTFPSSDTDPIPAFVKDQIIAMKNVDPTIQFSVLAPHDIRSRTRSTTQHEHYTEYRFHYFWPFSFEKLAGRGGIMPQLKVSFLYYGLIPFLFIGEFIALYRLTRKLRPDYLYAHWFTPQGVTNAWVGKLTNTPFVLTTHAADVDVWHKIPLIGRYVVRWHSRQARAITAVSSRSMAKLQKFFTEEAWKSLADRTSIIPMGINANQPDTTSPKDILKQKYNLDDRQVIFFMGRLAEKKGVKYLIEAFNQIDNEAVELVIAGDGPLREHLESIARKMPLARHIRFIGYVSGDIKSDYLQLADVVVLPSIITDDGDAEGLPVVFMEALAAGNICIATNESGADEIITHGVDGFLVPQKDSRAIADHLKRTMNLSSDERQTIGHNAQKTAQQFDWSTIARRHIDFFNDQLNL